MSRVFIALSPGPALQSEIAALARPLARSAGSTDRAVHWVAPVNYHLTLHFIGDVDVSRQQDLEALMAAAQATPAFEISLDHLGVLPSAARPRVLALFAPPDAALSTLHATLGEQLQQQGFAVESRPFVPHLTLARLKRVRQPLPWQLGPVTPLKLPVSAIELLNSEPGTEGPVYTRLRRQRLQGRPRDDHGAPA